MSYRPGYRFKVASTRDAQNKERPPVLYNNPWDHSVPPEEQWRSVVAVLEDGEEVEVIEYADGAVKVNVLSMAGLKGWLG